MAAAIALEGKAQRAALAGDWPASRGAFREAADRYRASWEASPPASYGRLVGMLKAAILAGDGRDEARYVQRALGEGDPESAPAAYALAVAALVTGDDEAAVRWSARMRGGSEPFDRAAAAIAALANSDEQAYRAAVEAIVEDFAGRAEHLTGVAFADTAMMLEQLAEPRGVRARIESPVLP
jgi:hypothetical protein